MKRSLRLRFCLALCCLLSFALSCQPLQDVPQPASDMTLEELGSLVHTSLGNLKAQSKSLIQGLEEKSSEVEGLKAKLSDLIACSERTNKQLYDYETKLVESETKRKILWKVVWTLIGVNSALLVALVILIVLEKKKITDLL